MITAEALRQEIENLRQQAQAHANAYQQALGAIQLAESMLNTLEDGNDLTVDQFAKMVGGNGATAAIEELDNG